ncbi:hypothetical protein SAMN05421738_105164 [Algoriella xinjiangensis]|uniref:Uncharacterized protein n=1 Tax=Algoriella xinjiangensis TaxID=684065 RepID=A0A1I4VIM0_9FLAO|nr:hypothetical protein [Algoriella xinjiangensis]SFN01059.1 hypothetical protein SAMN05421738_105164 [Algoriella xinjiangensis]VDH17194.1 Uncharacterised protein [Algoriella xinjiangensis]
MIDIKDLIDQFDKNQESISLTLFELRKNFTNDYTLEQLKLIDKTIITTPTIMDFIADKLQFIENEEFLKTFNLEDIQYIYKLLTKYYPYDLQYRLGLISFTYIVLDKQEQALEMIDNLNGIIKEIELNIKNIVS